MPFFGSLGILITRVLVVAAVVVYLFSEISTFVGNGLPGFFDRSIQFSYPRGVAADSAGNVYVADTANHRIRKITSAGVVTTLAGNGAAASTNGTGTNAQFYNPYGIAVDSTGNVYVADSSNGLIRKITPEGVVTTLAGGLGAFQDGSGTNATFSLPSGVAVDSGGNVYVADYGYNRIRKITPLGIVSTFAGNGTGTWADGAGTNASFNFPRGVAADSAGNVYVADFGNHRIRKITPLGVVSTIAGNGANTGIDGTGTNATFNSPQALVVDSQGNIYVGADGNYRIRKITPGGVVTTFAGWTAGFANGTGTNASFNNPSGVAFDSAGNLYVVDYNNHCIRKITPAGVVTTLAGSGVSGFTDSVQNGAVSGALLKFPGGVALDSLGNVYVGDSGNYRIRKITPLGVVTTLAGNGTGLFADGTGTNAGFVYPVGIVVDSAGNVYVADFGSYRIRKITPGGVVTTLAGNGTGLFADGSGTNAGFVSLWDITIDSAGNLYATDNTRIRKITSTGVVSTLAGSGTPQYLEGTGANARFLSLKGITINSAGTMLYVTDSNYIRKVTTGGVTTFLAGQATAGSTNATGTSASFSSPWGITVNTANTSVYIADQGNHSIRRVTTDFGVTTKYSGVGSAGFRETPVANVQYNAPQGIAVDSAGLVYVADTNNNRIRTIAAGADNTGVVTTFVGTSTAGYTDGGGWFNSPFGVATDWDGTVYVADAINNRIRKISPLGVVTSLAGSGTGTFSDGTGTSASFNGPRGVALGSDGTVYVADTTNNRIRRITFDGVVTIVAGNTSAGSTDGTSTSALFNAPNAITVNSSDIMYVADTGTHRIRAITQARVVSTFAGTTQGFQDGVGTNASFNTPSGIVADIYGNLYVADTNNHRIRRITSDGTVTTLTGDGTAGYMDGTGTNAQFNFPTRLSIDALGTLYVADQNNHRIRIIQPSTGVVTTLAGDGTAGFISSRFNTPQGVTVDRFRQAYVGDTGNHSIRKIPNVFTLPENSGVVSTIAGDGTAGFVAGNGSGARVNFPRGVGVDSVGNVYVGDLLNHRIRKITPAGVVTVLAGSGTATFADGTGTNASFSSPWGVAADSAGNVYVGDSGNNRIRKISPLGVVTTLAGGTIGFQDGTGTNARFSSPQAVAVDRVGNVYVADNVNHRIRKITPAAVVTVVAGQTTAGFADGTGSTAQFNGPAGVTVNSEGDLYVADYGNHRIRKITSGAPFDYPPGVVTTIAGSTQGSVNGTGTSATFNFPRGITVDIAGNVYVADESNHRIRKITPGGVVTTLAGSAQGFADGVGTNAQFNFPVGMSVDSVGNVYVGDRTNQRIRKIGTAVAQVPLNRGVVTTFAGSGTAGAIDGTGTNASFNWTTGNAVDSVGNVYVTDFYNHRIRRITPAGVVTTLAGSTQGFTNGTGTNAQFRFPGGIAVDSGGTVYVSDSGNHCIRRITSAAVVTTFAGNGTDSFGDGTGTNAFFSSPSGIAVDSAGNVYVVDTGNHCIRKITSGGVVTTLAGSRLGQFADGTGTNASFYRPSGVAVDSAGVVYVADSLNNRIRKITPAGVVTTLAGNGSTIFTDGTGTNATFDYPGAVGVDSVGTVYVADLNNQSIRKITPNGVVTTVAGKNPGGTMINGTGTNARFQLPSGVAVDSGGILYVSDQNNNSIRKIQ